MSYAVILVRFLKTVVIKITVINLCLNIYTNM